MPISKIRGVNINWQVIGDQVIGDKARARGLG